MAEGRMEEDMRTAILRCVLDDGGIRWKEMGWKRGGGKFHEREAGASNASLTTGTSGLGALVIYKEKAITSIRFRLHKK